MDSPIIIIWVSPLSFLGAAGVILKSKFTFRWNFFKQTELPQMGRRDLWRHIVGLTICLCPTEGTPGLNDLNIPLVNFSVFCVLNILQGLQTVGVLLKGF